MINFLKIRGVLLLICVLAVSDGIAQNFSRHNWYFGNSTRGIRFSRSDNSASLVTNQFTPFGTGGSAVATDQTNANLRFYTDGSRVIDLTHTQMPNGFGLNALTTANQPVAISPVPGSTTQFLIFTNTANYTTGGNISVTTVDISAFGNALFPAPALGNVTTKNVASGLTGRSEAMITVPNFDGTGFWLITHENGTDNYTVTQIGAGGTLTHTPVPNVTGFPISAANFSYHPATGKIAVSPQTADRNIAILNFNNTTGALTFDQFVLNSAVSSTINQAVYDTEWSLSGRFLYISRHGEAGINADVLQFDLNNPGNSLATILPSTPFRSYGLQMAPDSAIYHLYQASLGGSFFLGKFTDTDSLATLVNYTASAFGGNFNGTQFPAFAPTTNNNLTVSFITEGTCANSPVSFYPTVTPAADSLVWNFGDGSPVSHDWSPIHTYQNSGSFNVSVTAFLNGQSAIGNGAVNLTPFDLQLTLAQDTVACKCEFPPPVGTSCNGGPFKVTVKTQGSVGALTFVWSNGDIGATLTPDSAGYYYVVVTDAGAPGCVAYAGVNVREYDAIDQRANVWYFGQNAGIDFNTPTTAITGPLNTPEGCSVISDRNGFVIFSTDGVRVYDRNDAEVVIPVPPGIGGEQGATQSVLIIPVPGDETLYYIFTTQEVHGTNTYELRYSLYDIKLNGGNGGLAEYNQLLFSRSTERITGNGNWLIAHEYGNNSFRAYPITPTGIGNPVITSIGSDHVITDAYNGQGYMKLGGLGKLAVALPTLNTSNVIEIFDFDNATGVLSNFQSVNLGLTGQQVYGVEFYGNKLFASLRGTTSYIREIYFDFQGNPVLIPPPAPPAGEIPAEVGALQIGPDGQLYAAVNNQSSLGLIQVNADTLQLSTFVLNGFALAGGTLSKLGLPNFAQQVGTGPMLASMSVSGFCLGTPTDFLGVGTDIIDSLEWSFGDGFGATGQVAQHTYAAAGDYMVTLRVYNRCGLDTLITQQITIAAPPANPTFLTSGQPVLCNGPLTLIAEPLPGSAGYTYLWSTGETSVSISVSQQSLVSVVITNAQGCTSSGSIIVADNRPIVDLGPDQTICQNTPVASLNAQNPGTNYQWFLNEVNNGNITQIQSVNTVTFGVFEYKVQITDPITTCVAKDSVVFTIPESPNFSVTTFNTSSCVLNDGQLALTINSPLTNLFSYLVVGTVSGTTLQSIDRPIGAVLPIFSGLPADTYIVQVTDQVSGCATTATFGISNNVISITSAVAQVPTCDPIAIDVQTTGILAGSFPGQYSIINSGTGVQVVPPTNFGTANFTTVPVAVPGNYTVQINAQGCLATRNVNITSAPQVTVSFTQNLCAAQLTAVATGATFDWSTSPAGSINGATNGATVTINPGTWDLVVIATDGVNCPGTGTMPVVVEVLPVASFTQSDACADLVTLTATPTGPYTYRWYDGGLGGTLVVGGSSIVIGTSENGGDYGLEVVSTLTGCPSVMFIDQVFVAGDLQVAMTTTTPCEGSPFTLTATTTPPAVGANFQWAYKGTNISGATNDTYEDTREGVYTVTASLPGCDVPTEQTIILFDTPVGSLSNKAFICNDDANPNPDTKEILLDADPRGGAGFTYQWYQGGVLSPSNTDQTFLVIEPGVYSVEIENSFGCVGTDQTNVEKNCQPLIVAPTAFRPGSTIPENKDFYIFTYFIESEDFELFIYNRWGELVHQSSGLDPDTNNQSYKWNGGYKNNAGQLLPAGTYTYVVRYKSEFSPKDGIQEKRGGVVLLR